MTRNDLRDLFSDPKGQNVLLWILREHHVFSCNLATEQEIALHNWGMKFLQYMGPENTKQSVSEFMKVAMMSQEEIK